MAASDHTSKFIRVMDRLAEEAKAKGDKSFAEALSHCVLNVSGGNPDCPMGRLVLEEYLRSGHLPNGAGPPLPGSPGSTLTQTPPAKREVLIDRLHDLLKREAIWRKDQRFLDALTSCGQAIKEEEFCPLRRLLHASDPPRT